MNDSSPPRRHAAADARPPDDPRSFTIPAAGSTSPATVSPPVPPSTEPPREPARFEPERPERDRPRQRRWPRRLAWGAGAVVVLALAGVVYVWWTFQGIERIDDGGALVAGSETYLIVGTDSRSGIDPNDPNAAVYLGEGITGVDGEPVRSDTIILFSRSDGRTRMMALPRDLFLPIAGTGESGRINGAIRGGPERLIRTVEESLGVPVGHYMEIDFAGFIDIVDGLGHITIDFPYPATDQNSGLSVLEAGPADLDGTQALAYVRSRNYTELIDGQWRTDPTADLGRVERQQTFMKAIADEVLGVRNPLRADRTLRAITSTMRVDEGIGLFDMISMLRSLGASPETIVLPVTPIRTAGGASVLELAAGSDVALGAFR